MFSGYLANITGLRANDPTKNYVPPAINGGLTMPIGYTVFERVRQWFYLNKPRIVGCVGKPKNVGDMLGFMELGVFYNHHGFDVFDNHGDGISTSEGRQRFLQYAEDTPPYFYLFHEGYTDGMLHKYGVDSPQYRQSIIDADTLTAEICDKLKASNPAIIITSDHGGGCCTPTSHGNTPFTFLATNLPIVQTKSFMVDVAPTIYDYLNMPYYAFNPPIQGFSLMRPAPLRVPAPLTMLSKEEVMYGHEII